MSGYTLSIIGCGTMGIAILSGVLDSSRSRSSSATQTPAASASSSAADLQADELSHLPSSYIACVSRPESARRLRSVFPKAEFPEVAMLAGENVKGCREGDVVLLGCKPQLAEDILAEEGVREALEGKMLVSICAGLRIEQLQKWVHPSTKVVRAMPNTPAKIREGMTILSPLPASAPPLDSSILLSLFSSVGRCRFLPEKHFDACTALAGSGPAFACVFLEAMADGAVMMGLPRKEALELAAQTMQGAARMVLTSGMHPAAIKDSVTTPGGCTIAGLLNLEDGKVRSTVARTIQAAAEHAAGLGQNKK
ncbi:putative PRO3-delta 1-pyrroline-5-carboxylate reductase [Microstroma glucosiphilum]|uniref:Pyrroline-5-carboxylate reductase n=1 Tax=Pseudomicrostroma glucosiphilum TaxID=1684307 RepID=A0A316UAF4_9BASI|nr:putative PRO3-delta 1-pyrroline-5-carboxylate reductase [Pseudomicrostroma glucosiphilum]PWN21828.1 putative PRO3-delta 1-pyrroline-5-carboxylate reductase [Pseudomicrostroma glucosiphilum]